MSGTARRSFSLLNHGVFAKMMLNAITPIVLTYNEAANIARTLSHLDWAREIVVVDSFSTDQTLQIARGFKNTRIYQRQFDDHASQWNFAISQTGIETDWILALDADYVLPSEAIAEIAQINSNSPFNGYAFAFQYCVWGKPLRNSLYPPVTVLYRRTKAAYYQDGHTQRLRLDGKLHQLKSFILHDDRKSLSQWLSAQDRYARLESLKLESRTWHQLRFAERIRRFPVVSPFAVFSRYYIFKCGFLDGYAGLYYAMQRMMAEALLSLRVLELRLARRDGK